MNEFYCFSAQHLQECIQFTHYKEKNNIARYHSLIAALTTTVKNSILQIVWHFSGKSVGYKDWF